MLVSAVVIVVVSRTIVLRTMFKAYIQCPLICMDEIPALSIDSSISPPSSFLCATT